VKKVHIVTDSTADLPLDLYTKLGVTMIALNVHFGDDLYKDAIELSPGQFFEKLVHAKAMPRTSQPSPADFAEVYRRLAADGNPIVSIHVSRELSGTYQSALLAMSLVPEADVTLVDSRLASLGTGIGVIEAARMATAGKSKEEIVASLEALYARTHIFFAVDTLEFLQRNGRIGKASAFLGGLLSIKPVLTLREGVVHPVEKARGRVKALARLVELVEEKANAAGGGPIRVGVMNAVCPEDGQKVMEAIRQRVKVAEEFTAPIGATIGTHTGPGTLGVVFYTV
jgi:DegV family protein with EDD domain